jgi:enoyl-CoA hydratase/carnithine racemase
MSDELVLQWKEGRAGRIRLNRPKALNALNPEMVLAVIAALAAFAPDPAVHFVLIDAPARGFCAGGDVRALREAGMAGMGGPIEEFFTAEYAMNQALADFAKPVVSLIDGICMGGGIGLSVHGSHRVASERAVFAMPETAIALFPDVGTSYVLPRLPGALGMYLGLTGARLAGADAVHGGLATHFVENAKLPALAEALVADGVAAVAAFAAPLPAFTLAPHRALIDHAFAAPNVPEILHRLSAADDEFAQQTLAALRAHSPLSISWSFEIVRRGATSDLPACLAAELALVRKVAMHPEFHEGVRAVLVDKDRQPKWHPERLEDVDPAVVAAMFG